MRTKIKLTKEDREKARIWRIEKCGYDSFEKLFEEWLKEKEERKGDVKVK